MSQTPTRTRSQSNASTRTDPEREYYATNPQVLLSPSKNVNRNGNGSAVAGKWTEKVKAMGIPGVTTGGGGGGMETVPESWKSQVSMKTVRGRSSSSGSDEDDDDDGDTLVMGGTDSLSTSQSRARASTFGGVPLPPSAPTPAPPLESKTAHLSPSPELHPSSRSRSSSNASSFNTPLDPSLHLGGNGSERFPLTVTNRFPFVVPSQPFAVERPIAYAMCKAGLLFVLSLLVLWGTLKGLLPPVEEEDWEKVKLPKSLDELKGLNTVLQVYKEKNYWRVLGCYTVVYLFLQAFSIPGSMYLSILGGAMYGVLMALPLVCFCVATGALLCYSISAALGPALLLNSEKWQARVDRWKERIAEHDDNLISYLIVLRIAPVPPHFVVNLLAPHLGIKVYTFWISTFLGIFGVSYIHTTIGTTLDQMTSSSDFHLISWQNGLGLGGIIVAVLIPVALRRAWKKDLEQVATEEGDDSAAELLLPTHSHPRSSSDFPDLAHAKRGSISRLEFLDEDEEIGTSRAFEAKGKERAVRNTTWNGQQDGNLGKASKVLGVSVEGQDWR